MDPSANVLLQTLPESTLNKLLPHLRGTLLPVRTSLYEPHETPRYVHFLTSGIASIVTLMTDGATTEVGTVGREGLPQGLHLLGATTLPTRCFMQIAGTGYRMLFSEFRRLFIEEESLRTPVLEYSQYHSMLLSQLAACNRLHDVEARLARWLLMIQDRTGEPILKLTQEFLAQMIGSRRTTVSAVASALQERGFIEYKRAKVRILDRPGMTRAVCECYGVTRDLLANLYRGAGKAVLDAAETVSSRQS